MVSEQSHRSRIGLGGAKLGTQQPVPEAIGNLLGVLHIGLSPQGFLNLLWVYYDDLRRTLQNRVYRLPIYSGALPRLYDTSSVAMRTGL